MPHVIRLCIQTTTRGARGIAEFSFGVVCKPINSVFASALSTSSCIQKRRQAYSMAPKRKATSANGNSGTAKKAKQSKSSPAAAENVVNTLTEAASEADEEEQFTGVFENEELVSIQHLIPCIHIPDAGSDQAHRSPVQAYKGLPSCGHGHTISSAMRSTIPKTHLTHSTQLAPLPLVSSAPCG